MKRVAVLLAVYNGAHFLDEQIASILGQQDVEVHVFARDDGSSDRSMEILRDYARSRPERFTAIDGAGGSDGTAAGNFFTMLRTIDLRGFDFVAFADQDDIWLASKLTRAVTRLDQGGGQGYSSNLLAYDVVGGRHWIMAKSSPQVRYDYLFQGASAGCTYVLQADAASMVAATLGRVEVRLPVNASHDWIIYAICRSHGLRWVMDDEAHIVYRQHSNNVYGAQPGLKGLVAKAGLARQGWYRDHVRWLRNVLANSAGEDAILRAVERLSIADRVSLAWRAQHLRRAMRDRLMLRMAILGGLF